MSTANKGDIIKPGKINFSNKGSSASGTGTGKDKPQSKRNRSEVSPNRSMEEITAISHSLETLQDEMKSLRDDVKGVLTKSDMKTFIKETVTEVLNEINENTDLTISLKVEEKTKK